MKEIKFKDTIQFGIWKFLDHANGTVQPHFACVQPVLAGALLGDGHQNIQSIGDCGVGVVIGCEGATPQITLGVMTNGGLYEVYVNEQLIENSTGLFEGRSDYDSIATILARDHQIQLTGLTSDLIESTDVYKNDIEIGRFKNLGSEYVRIGIRILDANSITNQYPPLNPTFPGFSENYPVSFCLAPA